MSQSPSPGFYDDGSGRQRWWDGQAWTDVLRPPDAPPAAALPGATAPAAVAPPPSPPKPTRTKLVVIGVAALVVGVVGIGGGTLFALTRGYAPATVAEFLEGTWQCTGGPNLTGPFTASFDGRNLTLTGENPPPLDNQIEGGYSQSVTDYDAGFVGFDSGYALSLPAVVPPDGELTSVVGVSTREAWSIIENGEPSSSFYSFVRNDRTIEITYTSDSAVYDMGSCTKD